MAHQMMLTLSDQEYAALAAEAERTGQPVEAVLHAAIAPLLPAPNQPETSPAMTEREFVEYLYRKGVIMNIATGESDSPEEEAEIERIAQKMAGSQPLSEMVIEDRGPRE
jgi:hypothetical protein